MHRKTLVATTITLTVLFGIAFSLGLNWKAAQADEGSASGSLVGVEEAWPSLPEPVAADYKKQPELIRNARGRFVPTDFTEDPVAQSAQVLATIRYGSARVGTAYPWLVKQSQDLWTTPCGIASCFALLYFGDTSGFERIQLSWYALSRSPQHWLCVMQAAKALEMLKPATDSGDSDRTKDLLTRKLQLLPASAELTQAVMVIEEEALSQVVKRLDQESGLPKQD